MKNVFKIVPVVAMIAAVNSANAWCLFGCDKPEDKAAVVAPNPNAKYYPVVASRSQVVSAPDWFIRPPADTNEVLFAAGTATSSDEQMAYDKARMAAERKLIEMTSSRIQSQTKSYKADRGSAVIENYEQVTRKNANGELVGAQRVDSQTTYDGRMYKVYVLIRLPLGEANIARRESDQTKFQKEAEIRGRAAQRELDNADQRDQERAVEETERLKRDVEQPKTVSKAPVEQVITKDGRVINLLEVENAEYKARRDAALQKPGAVVGQTVVQ